MLSKEWLLLSANLEFASLRIAPGLTKPISESGIRALLQASDCRRYQPLTEGIKQAISLLNTLLSNPATPLPGTPVPIAQRHDARVALMVEQDRMSAVAEITADWGGEPLTTEQLEQALQASEISQGVQPSLIAAAIEAAREATPGAVLRLPVALGKAAVNGQDSRLERLVETPTERLLKPQALDHGRIDLRDLGAIVTVNAGTPLMRRHPATQGVAGFTVTGQALPAKDGKEGPISAGDGTQLSTDDPNLLIACRAGLPCQEPAGMRVDQILSVKQVDARHGHISFEGGLIVNGDVNSGMKIRVSGDIVIGGSIEGGVIEAGGSITVRQGILGRRNEQGEYLCHLNAQGDIHASYAQYARLEAGGDIRIQNQLSHCYSRSGKDIRVGDGSMRRGHLLGGTSIANRLIMAPILGASAYNQTRLQLLGGDFTHKEQEQALRQRKQECQAQLDKLQDLLRKLLQLPGDKRNPQSLSKIKLLLSQHLDESKLLDEQLATAQEALQRLIAEMEIIATQHLFPGVEVEMAHYQNRVDIEHGPIRFAIRKDQLQLIPYEQPK